MLPRHNSMVVGLAFKRILGNRKMYRMGTSWSPMDHDFMVVRYMKDNLWLGLEWYAFVGDGCIQGMRFDDVMECRGEWRWDNFHSNETYHNSVTTEH